MWVAVGVPGALDMLVDGSVPMGAVNVSSVNSRSLVATVTQMPIGSALQILRARWITRGSKDCQPTQR